MAKIAADINGEAPRRMPLSELAAVRILDARGGGIIFKADHVLSGNGHARVMPGPQAHWAKIAFERYFIASRKHGVTAL